MENPHCSCKLTHVCGRTQVIHTGRTGGFFGELALLSDEVRRGFTAALPMENPY